jgi:uncharacterized membrane protein YagU involved in acid resistance
MLKPIAVGTAVSGTLDILFAMILTALLGREIGNMLRYVGSGPFPQATEMGASGAILGLVVHFALMAIMAAVYVLAARRIPALVEKPIQWGAIYGLATYVVMNWLVVPMRFDTPLPPSPLSMATQLFAHIVLVGIPIALIAARHLRPRTA